MTFVFAVDDLGPAKQRLPDGREPLRQRFAPEGAELA